MNVSEYVFETEFKQRKYDGKWQKWIKISDPESTYRYLAENGDVISVVRTQWLVSDVYDYELEFV